MIRLWQKAGQIREEGRVEVARAAIRVALRTTTLPSDDSVTYDAAFDISCTAIRPWIDNMFVTPADVEKEREALEAELHRRRQGKSQEQA